MGVQSTRLGGVPEITTNPDATGHHSHTVDGPTETLAIPYYIIVTAGPTGWLRIGSLLRSICLQARE